MARRLRRELGARVRFSRTLPPHPPTGPIALAVGIFSDEVPRRARAFAQWTREHECPALVVELGAVEALVGPLAWPGRAGCWNCAWERRIAAAAFTGRPAGLVAGSDRRVAAATAALLGREIDAIRQRGGERSRLLDHVVAVDAATRDDGGAIHGVVPLSHCAVCGGAAAWPRQARRVRISAGAGPGAVVGALDGWLDRRTGVISSINVDTSGGPAARWPLVFTAAPPHVITADGALRRLPAGWGKGLTVNSALLSAVGEAVERYAASLPDPARLVWAPAAALEGGRLDPGEQPPYTEAQYRRKGFPFARYDAAVAHPWVKGHWLGRRTPVWVPAVDAYLSLALTPEQLINQGTSSGLAAAFSRDAAALRAVLELVERDAFLAAWNEAHPGRPLVLDGPMDVRLRAVLAQITDFGAKVELYWLPTGVIGFTMLALALGDGKNYPGATVGLGCDLHPGRALRQAILELGQTGPYLRRLLQTKAYRVPRGPRAIREMMDHAAYYFPRERAPAFDRLRVGGKPQSLRALVAGEWKRSLTACTRALDEAGVRVAVIDVTSPDVASGPFRVVRAVSPDLCALWYGYGLARRNPARVSQDTAAAIPPHPIW